MFSYSILKHFRRESRIFVRYKNPPHHWSVIRKKNHPVDKALNHFDDFYGQVFDKKWLGIRDALLGKQKYVAVVNNYGDSTETMNKFELNGALNIRTLFTLEKQYLQEELQAKRQKKALRNILNIARKLDEKVENSETNVEEAKSPQQFSLEASLKHAEYDSSRIIDSKNPLSTEILHEFVPATKMKGMEDFIPESAHYKLYDSSSKFSVEVQREYDIDFPEQLNVYCYEMDNTSDFDPPRRGSTGVYNYYVMDGGSVLPILALELKPGQRVLDMCAAPGGKSLLALQTLYPDCVVSNDVSRSRLKRIENVYTQFLYDFEEKWLKSGKIKLSNTDARRIDDHNFDRVLVDVPCTTDRHVLQENDNNIFKPGRIKERLTLPELQSEILVNALRLVKVGGIVVYSTCSLSPIQNDGVVHMALKEIWQSTKMNIVVKDLTPALLQTRSVYKLAKPNLLRYGHLVIPDLSQNYGPMYFCKMQKIK